MHTTLRQGTLRLMIAAGVLIVVAANGWAQGTSRPLAHGDQLRITVWGYPEFATTATVRDDGLVSIPLVGDVQAAGLTREEFVAGLKKVLAEYIQGDINITVSSGSRDVQMIAVLGAVAKPDQYSLGASARLFDALSAAGGYGEEANINRIRIFHADRSVPAAEVDLEQAVENGSLESLPEVHEGDVVYVPFRRNFIKDVGEYLGYVALFFAIIRITEE